LHRVLDPENSVLEQLVMTRLQRQEQEESARNNHRQVVNENWQLAPKLRL